MFDLEGMCGENLFMLLFLSLSPFRFEFAEELFLIRKPHFPSVSTFYSVLQFVGSCGNMAGGTNAQSSLFSRWSTSNVSVGSFAATLNAWKKPSVLDV